MGAWVLIREPWYETLAKDLTLTASRVRVREQNTNNESEMPASSRRRAVPGVAISLPIDAPTIQRPRVALGAPDVVLGGGLARGVLHEIFAACEADAASATGFAAAVVRLAVAAKPVLWVRHDALDGLTGRLHAPGLAEIGLDPDQILLVRAPDIAACLRAGAAGARCAALGAVLIEPWGESKLIDLTASRRLSLAARASGVPLILLRAGAVPAPSAATTRWSIAAAPSRPLPGDSPGLPSFAATLLRQRGGPGGDWILEWNHDRRAFTEFPAAPPLSRAVVPLVADRSAERARCAA